MSPPYLNPCSTSPREIIESMDPIFIGGAGRSGTSLLQAMLNAHPQVAIGPELKVTPAVAKLWLRLSRMESHLQQYFNLGQPQIDEAIRNFILNLLEPYRKHASKHRVGEKTPDNIFIFPCLHRIFPESPLVHVIRDGRDVVRSLLNQNWVTNGKPAPVCHDPKAAAKYWRRAIEAGNTAVQSPSLQKKYLAVQYEELVTTPEKVMRDVLSHIGESWDSSVLDFYRNKKANYNPKVHRPISTSSIGKWKEGLTPSIKHAIKPIVGPLLIKLEYTFDLDW